MQRAHDTKSDKSEPSTVKVILYKTFGCIDITEYAIPRPDVLTALDIAVPDDV